MCALHNFVTAQVAETFTFETEGGTGVLKHLATLDTCVTVRAVMPRLFQQIFESTLLVPMLRTRLPAALKRPGAVSFATECGCRNQDFNIHHDGEKA